MDALVRASRPFFFLVSLAGSMAANAENPTTMPFAPGGSIRMSLHSGAVEVVGTTSDKISVSWRSRDSDARVSVELREESANHAFLSIDGPGNRTTYRIEVPGRSDIDVKMGAGDLNIQGIAGSVKASLLAGNMDLTAAEPNDYGTVRASVKFGEVSARPWNYKSGGMWRSFKTEGPGRFEIDARVIAGELTIRTTPRR